MANFGISQTQSDVPLPRSGSCYLLGSGVPQKHCVQCRKICPVPLSLLLLNWAPGPLLLHVFSSSSEQEGEHGQSRGLVRVKQANRWTVS